ncbi:double zinc ribbon domain-containing protein [Alkalihalobacterium alkalicellulosilyticum]|uniref:double zinc ribbon domain-containing protein n=1 Tax=Alkalihalobacterium alkalicellulosilyticum TaxID=1912214 RepID=UPI0009976161|nr:zinc ribbon domain-containing protein [Bacillus alkalicellulosilyticus]
MQQYKQCQNCETHNPINKFYCTNCNESLKNTSINSKESIVEKKKECANCGATVEKNVYKCKECGSFVAKGTKLSKRPFMISDNNTGSDNSIALLLYIVALLLPSIGIIVGAIYTSTTDPYKTDLGKNLIIIGILNIVLTIILYIFLLRNL